MEKSTHGFSIIEYQKKALNGFFYQKCLLIQFLERYKRLSLSVFRRTSNVDKENKDL